MDRNIYQKLETWQKSPRRKPLVINGARQVGKTYSLKHFGKKNYEKYVYFNFEKDEKIGRYFEETLDPHHLINIFKIHSNIEIEPHNTLLIFDEVQECSHALNSLKYFCEDAPDFHVAAAGSLLGVKTARQKGFPVGKVNFLHLYPLTFFEFLGAIGKQKMRVMLEEQQNYEPLPVALHEQLIQLLKIYFFTGGMPEVVAEYAKNENLETVREIQLEILNAYEKDFAKHAPPFEMMKITTVWNQVHRQLSKENKKFIFAAIRKSARARDYEEAVQWLVDAGLIYKSYLIESPKFPLDAYAKHQAYKIFLLDVGLLGAHSNLSAKTIIDGDSLFIEFKGSLTENYVAQELIATKNQHPFYWASEGTAEIDFLIEEDHGIVPLEVKAGNNKKKKSLLVYDQKYSPSKLLRTTTLNLKHDGKIYNYPLYLISRLLN